MLESEFQYYKGHQADLVAKYDGQYLVIVGEEVKGAHDQEIEAYLDGKARFGLGKFLIQHCFPGKESYTRKFRNRIVLPA